MNQGYNVTETKPGQVNIACNISGRPFDRVNADGMYCDAKDCVCKRESAKVTKQMKEMLGSFLKD